MWFLLLAVACNSQAPVPPASAPSERVSEAPPRPAHGLTYLEKITDGGDPSRELPLVVAVHGLGDRPDKFVALMGGLQGPARVIVPAGPIPHGKGHSWFNVRVRDGKVDLIAEELAESADRVASLIEELQASKPTTGKPKITGFSQGGMISFAVATRHPTLVSEAIPLSGWLPAPLLPTGPPPTGAAKIRAFHGDADNVVALGPTQEGVQAMAALGWPVTLEVSPGVAHTIPMSTRKKLWQLLEP